MKRLWIPLLLAGGAAGMILAGCGATRAGYESAPYKVVRSEGRFEVRDYPVLTVVETPTQGAAANGGFNRLFRFITGGNESSQKIAMTTPVFMSGRESNATMAFVMPSAMKTGDVPKPRDPALRVRELEGGRYAVHRFRGGRNPEREAESLQRLQKWMVAQGMQALSEPTYGYFDPPWTPAFLRRNEVMVKTSP